MGKFGDAHQAFTLQLEEAAAVGDEVMLESRKVERYQLNLGDPVTTPEGYAFIEEDTDSWIWCFEIGLGGENARRLVEFLKALPDEPEEK
jgi:hypothetical protein